MVQGEVHAQFGPDRPVVWEENGDRQTDRQTHPSVSYLQIVAPAPVLALDVVASAAAAAFLVVAAAAVHQKFFASDFDAVLFIAAAVALSFTVASTAASNGWLSQIDPPACLFVVAVAATAAVVDAAGGGGLTGLAVAVQKNHLCCPKAVLPDFFLVFPIPPPVFFHV